MSRRRRDVRIWNVQDRRGSGRKVQSRVVRWVVDGKQSSRSFRSRALADRFRASILLAHDDGEELDRASSEPVSWTPLPGDTQIHQWARRWLADQWTEWQPRTRRSAVEALVKFVPLVVSSQAPVPPPEIRVHLKTTLEPGSDIDPQSAAERWLQRWSLPLTDLNRERLSTIDIALGVALDGSQSRPSVEEVLEAVETKHAQWAEAQLLEEIAAHGTGPDPATIAEVIDSVRAEVMGSVGVVDPTPPAEAGDRLRASDGRPVHVPPSAVHYTTRRHLER